MIKKSVVLKNDEIAYFFLIVKDYDQNHPKIKGYNKKNFLDRLIYPPRYYEFLSNCPFCSEKNIQLKDSDDYIFSCGLYKYEINCKSCKKKYKIVFDEIV